MHEGRFPHAAVADEQNLHEMIVPPVVRARRDARRRLESPRARDDERSRENHNSTNHDPPWTHSIPASLDLARLDPHSRPRARLGHAVSNQSFFTALVREVPRAWPFFSGIAVVGCAVVYGRLGSPRLIRRRPSFYTQVDTARRGRASETSVTVSDVAVRAVSARARDDARPR